MLTDGDYIVRMVNFPGDVNAAIRVDCDDFGNIYINDSLSPEAKKKAFEHECRHLERDDLSSYDPIEDIER